MIHFARACESGVWTVFSLLVPFMTTVYIHIGTLFAELTKTVPSLHMHRKLL